MPDELSGVSSFLERKTHCTTHRYWPACNQEWLEMPAVDCPERGRMEDFGGRLVDNRGNNLTFLRHGEMNLGPAVAGRVSRVRGYFPAANFQFAEVMQTFELAVTRPRQCLLIVQLIEQHANNSGFGTRSLSLVNGVNGLLQIPKKLVSSKYSYK